MTYTNSIRQKFRESEVFPDKQQSDIVRIGLAHQAMNVQPRKANANSYEVCWDESGITYSIGNEIAKHNQNAN